MRRSKKPNYRCVSLFSGGGGLDLGLEAAGFNTVLATDIDEHSCISLARNKEQQSSSRFKFLHDAEILRADVTKLAGKDILAKTGLKKGQLDLLAGGPPCQAFSVFGKRKGSKDPRGQLVYHYLRLIEEVQPKAFLFENVYGLLTIEKGKIFKELQELLQHPCRGLKYTLSVHRLDASDYGVPQFRDRVFIIGSREGRRVEEVKTICADQSDLFSSCAPPRRTVRDALRGLPKIGSPDVFNHTGRVHSERIVDRYSKMKFGERDAHTRINKLDPRRPSFTIIVGSDAGGGKGHVHPYEPREVTPRESARIQCFPDWWWFSGTSRHPIRQIGNAVPSLLGFAVGRAVMTNILSGPFVPFKEALERLGQRHLFTDAELKNLQE